MNSGIFYHNTYSSNSLNFSEQQEFPNFENPEDNFTENFNKAFQLNSPDIKEDSISEINNLYDMNYIDEFIIRFQNENLNNYYFKKDFDGIINQIEKQFPFFFNEKNKNLLYLIEKLRFFNLLKENKFEEAKAFYQEKLIVLLKDIKKQNWEIKSKFFIKLLKKPVLIEKQGNLQKKYYDQFTFELEKAIRVFLHEENDELSKNDFLANSNNNYFASSSSLDFDNYQNINYNKEKKIQEKYMSKKSSKEKETNDGDNEINTNKNNNNEESEEFDIDNFSTKEEFSDFEDELQAKMSNDNENQNNTKKIEISENNIKINKFINEDEDIDDIGLDPVDNNNPFCSNWSVASFSKSHKSSYEIELNQEKDKNEFIIDTSSKNNLNIIKEKDNFDENKKNNAINENQSKFENINTHSNKKKNNKKEKKKNEEIIFNQLPFLSSFKPRYIKRETIDKKIIRTFKNYVVKENKEKRLEIDDTKMDYSFFINLLYGNLSPPIDFVDGNTGEVVKFNSFNCNFLLWFFSKRGVKDVYMQFINVKGKEFINQLSEHYEISNEEKNQLNNYIYNFPFIFDISIINNITNGAEVTHLYRSVEKNKKIKNRRKKGRDNDLNLKKMTQIHPSIIEKE